MTLVNLAVSGTVIDCWEIALLVVAAMFLVSLVRDIVDPKSTCARMEPRERRASMNHREYFPAFDDDRCRDCGEPGELIGHMGCQYPQDHNEEET
jgi:hypothetical protein